MVEGCGVGHAQYESHATPDTSHSRAVEPNTNTTFVLPTFRSDTNTTTQTPLQFSVYNNEQHALPTAVFKYGGPWCWFEGLEDKLSLSTPYGPT